MQRHLRSDRGFSPIGLVLIIALLTMPGTALSIAAVSYPAKNISGAVATAATSLYLDIASLAVPWHSATPVPTRHVSRLRSSGTTEAATVPTPGTSPTIPPPAASPAVATSQNAAMNRISSAGPSTARRATSQTAAATLQHLAVATVVPSGDAYSELPSRSTGLVLSTATSAAEVVTRAELAAALTQLRAELTPPFTFSGPPATTPISTQAFAVSQKIDNLSGVTVSNSTIDAGSIPDLSGKYLNLSGGIVTGTTTFSGNVGIGTNSPSHLLTVSGDISVNGMTIGLGPGNNFANTGVGYGVFASTTSGYSNAALGYQALTSNTSGYYNVAFGRGSLFSNTTAIDNVAFGASSLQSNTTGSRNVAVGFNSLSSNTTGQFNTAIGAYSGTVTTGSYNIDVGYNNGGPTTGSRNIIIGNQVSLASTAADGQLNIGNIIFGTGVVGTGSTIAGNVGIGTTSPTTFKLQVAGNVGPDASNSYNLGAAGSNWGCLYYNGGTTGTCASDERLKTDIQPLTFDYASSTALDQIAGLTLRSFAYKSATSSIYHGLIAQEVQQVAPELVAEDASTTILSVKYGDIQWLVAQGLQELIAKVNALADTVAGFVEKFTTNDLTFTRAAGTDLSVQQLTTGRLCANKSDGTSVCLSGDQLAVLLAQAGGAAASASTDAASISDHAAAATTTIVGSSTPSVAASTPQPPVIQINGQNPAIIYVGDTYNDLGATIVNPDPDRNLSIKTFLNGRLVSNIGIDSTKVATDTIDYVVSDPAGLTATTTRLLLIKLEPPPETSTPSPAAASKVPAQVSVNPTPMPAAATSTVGNNSEATSTAPR